MSQDLTPVQQAGGIARFVAQYQATFARVAPPHIDAEAFMGLTVAALQRDDKLMRAAEADPASMFQAIRTCAALGHMPGDHFHYVPFGRSVAGIESYKGVIQRFYRSGGVASVHSEVVRANDSFQPSRGGELPYHEWDWAAGNAERGVLKGVYAWCVLASGATSQVVVLNHHDVAKYRAVSKAGAAFWGPPWPEEGPWTEAMWRKTAFHRLEPLVPNSPAYLNEFARAGAQPVGIKGVKDGPVPSGSGEGLQDVRDAVVVEDAASDQVGLESWPPVKVPPAESPQ